MTPTSADFRDLSRRVDRLSVGDGSGHEANAIIATLDTWAAEAHDTERHIRKQIADEARAAARAEGLPKASRRVLRAFAADIEAGH